ncbi:MAG: UvrD-helicase domain-containing protein, partial [Methylobacteriaceae bacterium]|nr:UvrD-helicase domain-containing protein [Methylobacteriaceae bacterium]
MIQNYPVAGSAPDALTEAEHRGVSPAAATPSLSQRVMTSATRGISYLDGLNPEQRLAVETTEGPVLVLAGAGTGKTRVLTTRIAHLIATGKARPHEILAVTFTNKAAREMQERVTQTLGTGAGNVSWLGTFHSIGSKILRRHAELVDLQSNFTILGTDDQLRLLKQLIQANDIDEKRWPARQLLGLIDNWKNRGLTPDKVPPGEGASFGNGGGLQLYQAYQARLKDLNSTDFGDLLLECLRLWQEHPDVLKVYQDRFKYILVDEYQDSNVAQYLWLRLIAQARRNLCCVGDDDQSIYSWRGAEVDNILRFEYDFPGARVIRLEQNYRSTKHILAAASELIAKNRDRLGKTLRTDGEDGDKIALTGAWDSEEEARLIGEEVESLQSKRVSLSEIAVLVRTSAQMREIEDRFVTLGIPYRVVGGPRFYERQEIRDALAYLRCVISRADDLAFERIINVPKRGLGNATLQSLFNFARVQKVSLMDGARMLVETDELTAKVRGTLRELLASFDRWSEALAAMPHSEVAQQVLEESGYTDMWKREKSADAAGRLENLKELVHSMEEFPDLHAFIEHVSLVMDAGDGEGEARVNLMTL